jgi:hypothetical protein
MDGRNRNTRTYSDSRRNSNRIHDDPIDMNLEREAREKDKAQGEKFAALLAEHHASLIGTNTKPQTKFPRPVSSGNIPVGGSSMGLI